MEEGVGTPINLLPSSLGREAGRVFVVGEDWGSRGEALGLVSVPGECDLGEVQLLQVRWLSTFGFKSCSQSLVLVVLWLVGEKDNVPAKKLCTVCLLVMQIVPERGLLSLR